MRRMKPARSRAAFGLVAAALVAMLVTPILSAAQTTPRAATAEAPAAQAEFLQVQQELARLEQEVLKDPAIRAEFDAVQAEIQKAARALDPRHQVRIDRLGEIREEIEALNAAGKTSAEDLQPLITEARGLQERVIAVQDHVARAEPLRTRIQDLRVRMTERMAALDPGAPEKLERLTVLAKDLSASRR